MKHIDYGRKYILIKGPIKLRIDVKSLVISAILLLAIFVLAMYELMVGTLGLSIGEVFGALFGQETGMTRTVVVEWRLPRVIGAIVFGAGLAVSGRIFQSLTKNPLGSPDIIGFTAGSYTGVLVVLLVLQSNTFVSTALGALIGGFVTAIAIYLLAFQQRVQSFRLIIVGIAISTFLGSINSILLIKSNTETALNAAAWGMGSLNGVTWGQVIPTSILVIVLLLSVNIFNRAMIEMALGDDLAKSHGVSISLAQFALIFIAVALTAAPTAVMGPVSFIALVAPQIAKRLVGTEESLIPVAAMGSLLLLGADILAQRMIPGVLLPVGVVTLSLGGIYLVWLLYRQARTMI